jgi:hypothetical protein
MIYVLQPESAVRFQKALDLLEHDHTWCDTWNEHTCMHELPQHHQDCLTMVEPYFLAQMVQTMGFDHVRGYADRNWLLIGNDIMNSSCWRCMSSISPAYAPLEPLFGHPRIWRFCDDAHAQPQEIEILSSWWYALDIGSLVAPRLQHDVDRKNQFFAMVNGYRPYRQQILDLVHSKGLLETNFVIYHGHQGSADMASRLQQLEPFADLVGRRLTRDHNVQYEEAAISRYYSEYSCELVLESLVQESLVTEKLVRPILAQMPFVCFAGAGHLAYIQKLGFKTFHDMIDESYDQENSITKRIHKIVDVLVNLCKMPNGFLEFRSASKDILQHNFDHLFWLNGRKDLDYAMSLQKFLNQCKIPTSTTIHPSWNMNKNEYFSSQAAAKRGPWFDYPSGRDHYLTNKDKA